MRGDDPFVGSKRPVTVEVGVKQGRLRRKIGITSPKGKFGFDYSVKWKVGDEHKEKTFKDDPWVIIF